MFDILNSIQKIFQKLYKVIRAQKYANKFLIVSILLSFKYEEKTKSMIP